MVQLGNMQEAKDYGTHVSEQARNLRLLWENTCACVKEDLWARRKVPALYVQGFKGYVNGLACRPVLPCQAAVISMLNQRFRDDCKSLEWLPDFALSPRPFELLPWT